MIAGGVVLLAVFSLQEGYLQSKAGYQSSVVQRFDNLEQCELVGKEFYKVYNAGSFAAADSKRAMTCLDLDTGVSTKVKY